MTEKMNYISDCRHFGWNMQYIHTLACLPTLKHRADGHAFTLCTTHSKDVQMTLPALPSFHCSHWTRLHTIPAVQAMLLLDRVRNVVSVNSALWADRRAAPTADAGVCDVVSLDFLLCTAEGKRGTLDWLFR